MSDWSGVSTDDLITIREAFQSRVENDDGTVTITLTYVLWSRCFVDHVQDRH